MATLKDSIKQLLSQKGNVIADLAKQAVKLRDRRAGLTQQIEALRQCNVTVQDYIDIACGYIDLENENYAKVLAGDGWRSPNYEGNGFIMSNPSFSNAVETPLRVRGILNSAFTEHQVIGQMSQAILYFLADGMKKGVARLITEMCIQRPESFNASNRPMAEIQADIDTLKAQIAAIDTELEEITDQARQLGEEI
jgi:cell division protein FtsB